MLDLSQWILLLTLSSARFLICLIKRKRENKTKGQKQLKGWNLMQKATLTTYSSCIFFVALLNGCIKFSSAHIEFKCKGMSELMFYAFNWIINPFKERKKKKKKSFCHVVLTFGEIFEEILIPFLDPLILLRRPRWVCETQKIIILIFPLQWPC